MCSKGFLCAENWVVVGVLYLRIKTHTGEGKIFISDGTLKMLQGLNRIILQIEMKFKMEELFQEKKSFTGGHVRNIRMSLGKSTSRKMHYITCILLVSW